jgi:hypothetical protein
MLGNIVFTLTFVLDAQQVNDVGVVDGFIHVCASRGSPFARTRAAPA